MDALGAVLGSRLARNLGTGLAGTSAGPDSILNQLAALGEMPTFRFSASNYTLSGGNIAKIPNRLGSDSLVLAAGTLTAPATDPLFAGAKSALFTGSQWLDSDLPSSSWKFLHDGTGCEVINILAFTAATGGTNDVVHATSTSAGGAGASMLRVTAGTYALRTINSGTNLIVNATAGSVPTGTPSFLDWYLSASGYGMLIGSTPVASGPASGFSSSNPVGTFRLGARTDASFPARMRWVETLIVPRVMSPDGRSIMRAYANASFGTIAA